MPRNDDRSVDALQRFVDDLTSRLSVRVVDVTVETPFPDAVVAIGPTLPLLHCVVYRTGGTLNFKWHRTLAMTPEEALVALDEVVRGGYPAHVENFFSSLAVGLPEAFDPEFPQITEWH